MPNVDGSVACATVACAAVVADELNLLFQGGQSQPVRPPEASPRLIYWGGPVARSGGEERWAVEP